MKKKMIACIAGLMGVVGLGFAPPATAQSSHAKDYVCHTVHVVSGGPIYESHFVVVCVHKGHGYYRR